VGLTVTVTVFDCNGDPLTDYPAEQITFHDPRDEIQFCATFMADHATDAQGQTTFSGAVAGGGWGIENVLVLVHTAGFIYPELPLSFNSPDINGDLVVDLADVGLFAQDFGNGAYDFRSDFTHDGVENLSDVGRLVQHYGESCP
jgi:hypothetical protein